MPTRIVSGQGSLEKLAQEVSRINRKCLLVTGRRSSRLSGALEKVQDALLEAKIESILFDQVEPNPSIQTVYDGAELARSKGVRWILGLGGGSAMDAAKAIALMTVSQDDIRHFFKGMRPTRPPLPIVTVPTTSGTGSEVTPFAVITDQQEGDKFGLSMPQLFPSLSILDPMLTLTMPVSVTVDTGLDALCHAIEALFSSGRSVFSDLYARSAMDRVISNLAVAKAEPENIEARYQMQLGAMFAGMAIADTATLVPHALGYPVTVRYDLPHGRATALLTPAFLEKIKAVEPERVEFVGRLLGNVQDAPEAMRAFIEEMAVAPRLGAYGVHEDDIVMFSEQVMNKPHLARSPGKWDVQDILDVYRRSM